MSIVVSCPYCSNQASVDPRYAGHQVQCPHCGGVMVVPAAQPVPAYHASPNVPQTPHYPTPGYIAPAAPETFLCAECGGMFVKSDGVDVGGTTYCQSCAAAVTPASVSVTPSRSRGRSKPPKAGASSAPAPAFEVLERCDACDGSFSATDLQRIGDRHLCATCAAAAVGTGKDAVRKTRRPPVKEVPPADTAQFGASDEQSEPAVPAASAFTPRKRKTDYTGLIVAGVVVLAVGVGSFFYLTQKPVDELPKKSTATTKESASNAAPTTTVSDPKLAAWEAAKGKEIRSLERLATGQLDRKDYASADQSYARLIELAKSAPGGKGPQDAGLKALLDGAQRKWDAIKPDVPKTVAVSADTKAEIDRLLREADFAAKGGSKPAAFERYREVLALASGNTLKGLDPAMQQRVAEADKARRQLFEELRGRKDAFDITANQLLDTGYAALSAGKWEAALDTLWDVRLLADRRVKLNDRMRDEDYIRGAHGVAVAYIGLGEAGQAADMFDESQTLGIVAEEKPTKELLWNRGIFDIESKVRASRTVRELVAYLSKDETTAIDEDLLNLLGTAIATAIAQPGEDLPALYKAADYYKKRNQQLETAKGGGQMHWGINWLSQADGAALTTKKEAAEKVYKQLNTQLEAVKKKLNEVKRGEKTAIKRNGATIYVTRVNEEQLKAAQGEFDAKLKEVKAAHAEIPKAQWLTDIKPMIPGTGVVFGAKPATAPTTASYRKFARNALAFPIDRYRLLTAAGPLGDRKQVRLEDMDGKSLTATVIAKDERLALLEVSPGDAGRGLKFFNFAIGYAGGPITCATVPVPSAFGPAPEQVKAVKPQRPPTGGAAAQPWILELEDHPRLAGAPLLDADNRVVGVGTGRKDDPKERTAAASLLDVQNFLAKAQALPEEESDQPAGAEGIYLVAIDLG